MNLQRIVVATDESEAGRQAVRTGAELTGRASSRLFVMRVTSRQLVTAAGPVAVAIDGCGHAERERLESWLDDELADTRGHGGAELEITAGVPSIEICRYAEFRRADLLVLGRKSRSQVARLLLGDTADAVARRSRVPCLFVPPRVRPIERVLVALDGTERGLMVLREACGFARAAGAALAAVTVEPASTLAIADAAVEPPLGRTLRVRDHAREIVRQELGGAAQIDVELRRGETVPQVLLALEASSADVLALGFHRGGPPGVFEAGSVARRLAHSAPGAVLTIPF